MTSLSEEIFPLCSFWSGLTRWISHEMRMHHAYLYTPYSSMAVTISLLENMIRVHP